MHDQRLLAISVAALALLGTILLGMGQMDASLPLLMLTVAVTSVYFTDIKGWFRLNRVAASVGAVIAAAMAVADWNRYGPDQRLVAIANFLVYLQVVLLYQEKTTRVYWQLLAMSLLQVVVAAVLNLSVVFGFLLVAYLFLALATLGLFFIHRETQRYPVSYQVGRGLAPAGPGETGVEEADGPRRQLHFLALDSHPASHRRVDWGAFRTTVKMALTTLAVTVVIFFSVPRFGGRPWRGRMTAPHRMVGFSQTVRLGELGYVLENPQRVMRIQFVDLDTQTPIEVAEPPLLRGAIVNRYAPRTSLWSQQSVIYDSELSPLKNPPAAVGLVAERITLEPLSEPVVCCVFPAFQIDPEAPIAFDPSREQLVRPEPFQDVQVSFRIVTTGFRDNVQLAVTPQEGTVSGMEIGGLLQPWSLDEPVGGDRRGVASPLAGLRATAAKVLRERGIEPGERVRAAFALQAFLRDSGLFHYALQPQPPPRVAGTDPVEAFVTENRRGHCEYFASALALMLRSQGIPSRVVIGFAGGEWNVVGKFYEIRQWHAHTWVEAYLEPQHAARLDPALGSGGKGGGWLRLDPTPAADGLPLPSRFRILTDVTDMVAYAELLWTSYVVGLNRQKQKESIYAPVANAIIDAVTGMLNPRSWRPRAMQLLHWFRDTAWTWLTGNWFSWRGGLSAMVLCLILVGLYHVVTRAWRWLRRWVERRQSRGHARAALGVRFYHRLELLLRRYGITRSTTATQREFATSVGGQLADLPAGTAVAGIPRQIVESFYRVRFGGHSLDSSEAEAVERALSTLETALRETGNRGPRTKQ
jgi:transglutaminase-like putative cysteine protease